MSKVNPSIRVTQIQNSGFNLSIPTLSGNDTLVGQSTSATLTNKNLNSASTYVVDNADPTKRIQFSASGASTGVTATIAVTSSTNQTFTLPATGGTISTTGTVVDLTSAQTISGVKTFSAAPVISTITNTGTLTLPTSTDTLVGRATTDTLTNKTLTAPVISTITNTGTLTLPTSTDTLVGRATTDTLTNKTLVANSSRIADGTDSTKQIAFTVSGNSTGVVTTIASASTSNQTFTLPASGGGTIATTGTVVDLTSAQTISGVKTFSAAPVISTITNTGTLTLPTSTDTLVGRATTDTLTNKTLTAPVISTITNTGTLTLPTSTDTLVGRNTTDTLTNKTLTAPVISTITNTGTLTLPTSTDTLVGRATTDTLSNKTFNQFYTAPNTALTSTQTIASTLNNLIPLNSASAFTITLPASSGNNGVNYRFINVGAGVVTLSANTGDNFDGNGSITTLTMNQFDRVAITCYNGSWYTF